MVTVCVVAFANVPSVASSISYLGAPVESHWTVNVSPEFTALTTEGIGVTVVLQTVNEPDCDCSDGQSGKSATTNHVAVPSGSDVAYDVAFVLVNWLPLTNSL